MAIIRKKLLAKPAPGPKALGLNPAGKGKPAPKKPAEKPAAKPGHAPSAGAHSGQRGRLDRNPSTPPLSN